MRYLPRLETRGYTKDILLLIFVGYQQDVEFRGKSTSCSFTSDEWLNSTASPLSTEKDICLP